MKSKASAKLSVFEFSEYKTFLTQWIEHRPGGGHGEKSKIAQNARCQLAYVSQVLNGDAHFSFEQGEALLPYLELTEDEGDYFLLLIQKARAGTPSLKKYLDRKMRKILDQRLILKNRLVDKTSLNREDQAIYYSHWTYSAIHIGVLVPELRSPKEIAEYFGIGLERTREILTFLESVGLVTRQGGLYHRGNMRIHLESDSPMISKHHINWRLQAMQSLERTNEGELHYSSVIGISKSDVSRVREIFVKAIEEARSIIKESKDEEVYSYTLDLFRLGGR